MYLLKEASVKQLIWYYCVCVLSGNRSVSACMHVIYYSASWVVLFMECIITNHIDSDSEWLSTGNIGSQRKVKVF